MKARAFFLAWLALLCLAGAQTALGAEEPITIGTTASLSGIFAAPGDQQLRGISMWVDDINARGALLGRRVKLIYYDDRSDPDVTVGLYERLIEQDKVDLLIGPYSSELTLAASRVAEAHDFPMVAAGAAAASIWSQGYQNIFQVDAPAGEYMNLLIASAKDANLNRIALIFADTDFTREVADGVRAQAADHGMEIVFDEAYPLERSDFSGLVRRMLPTQPEVVIGATYLNDSVGLMQEAKKQQLAPKAFAFTVGPALPEFGEILGPDAEGVLGVVAWMLGNRVPMSRDFSFRFQEKYGRNAGVHAVYGYSAGQVLEAAVRLAGSLDKDAIRQQLREMKFRSLLGFYRVDATGRQRAKSIYVMQWQNGRRRLVLPKEMRDSQIVYPFVPWSER